MRSCDVLHKSYEKSGHLKKKAKTGDHDTNKLGND